MQHTTSSKSYLAIVRGHVRAPLDVEHPLDDDDVKGSERKEARSRLEPVLCSTVERVSLVRVVLWTGRRHQARRHCKHVSHPIIGDATHGKGPLNRDFAARYGLSRLCLHAERVVVDDVTVEAPLPADWRAALDVLFPGDVVTHVIT
jgi:tRNA pseudouridine65 synthase